MPRHIAIARALGPIAAQLAEWQRHRGVVPAIHIACSGGPDSVALFGLLRCLQRRFALRLSLGHVNHGLRAAAAAEAEAVRELGRQAELAVHVDVLDLAPGSGLPARARAARYEALWHQARVAGASILALGHSATDQAETMLMHLVRGCGLDGLAAMPAYDNHGVWRPCLHLDRPTLRELAGHLRLDFFDDPTNRDTRHFRVLLRESILPALARENPRVIAAFAAAADHARAAQEALEEWTQREIDQRSTTENRHDLHGFHHLPEAIRWRVIREIAARGGVDLTQLRSSVVADIANAAQRWAQHLAGRPHEPPSPRPMRWDLHPNCVLSVDRHGVQVIQHPIEGRSANEFIHDSNH